MIKKSKLLYFTNKVKVIKTYSPEKINLNIENKFSKEIDYFQKKYSFKITLLTNSKLIIPEKKIDFLNKSKKIINKIKNIKEIKESSGYEAKIDKSKEI